MTRRRAFFLAAAILTVASLALPLWGFRMSAPQYPDEALHLRVARTGIQGDVQEITTLQKYIGVRFPERLPELEWLTPAILGLATLLIVAGLAGPGTLGRAVRAGSLAIFVIFLLASAGVVQARLHAPPHDRDRTAPIRSLHDFTPPLIGPAKVGNFTVWSFPHAGAWVLLLAGACLVAGIRVHGEA